MFACVRSGLSDSSSLCCYCSSLGHLRSHAPGQQGLKSSHALGQRGLNRLRRHHHIHRKDRTNSKYDVLDPQPCMPAAKKDFIVGADINMFKELAEAGREGVRSMVKVLNTVHTHSHSTCYMHIVTQLCCQHLVPTLNGKGPHHPPYILHPIGETQASHPVFDQMASGKTKIAAINGSCLGGGAEFALACHYRIAATSASIGFPEVLVRLCEWEGEEGRWRRGGWCKPLPHC
jgi:hypothetical protein